MRICVARKIKRDIIGVKTILLERGNLTMTITDAELKLNLEKYLSLSMTEDIFITRNGKIISKLSNPFQAKVDIATSLFGSIPSEMKLEETKDERAMEQ